MLAPWAHEEMETVDLKDKRLNDRLAQILSDLGERPTASIPAACGGHNEMVAAYRFFDNEKVTYESILQGHYECTRRRLAAQQVVLLVQDTSELDVTRPQQQVAGAGPLDSSARRGAFSHVLEGFTTDGTPLGAVWVDLWAREDDAATPQEKKQRRRVAPIEDKESFRWLEGLRQARAVAQDLPEVLCVCVADSEADIYELFAEPRGERPVHWLIRACHADRVLQPAPTAAALGPDAADVEGVAAAQYLRDQVLAAPVVFTKEVAVRGREAKVACDQRARRQPRQSRTAQVEVRAATVILQPPRRPDQVLSPVTVNVVLVREIDPPADDEPVEWLLLTTLPIETAEQVRQIVQYYTVRFLIEVFFRVLKSGCRVEGRRFEHLDRLLPCVAVYLIAAWRTLMLCRLGRSCPDLNCEAVFEPAEWKAVWKVTQRGTLPKQPPRLEDILKLIAQLGGYVNRPGRKDPPGPQTLWLGLQRMRDLAWAWNSFGPGADAEASARDV
jgi:transposase-like protein/transposase Tn5 family protein/DDE family transposase